MQRFSLFLTSRAPLLLGILVGVLSALLLPRQAVNAVAGGKAHLVVSWDVGTLTLLLLWGLIMIRTPPMDMPARAKAQEDGEWTVFAFTLGAIFASLFVIILEFQNISSLKGSVRGWHLALVVVTLLLSWLTMQLIFSLRYAHEFYASSDGSRRYDGGLDFPHEPEPDYFDFVYFAMVLGMTFQVSDVDITSRKIRRLATLHGFVGFLFNTVILALTVNIAASLL
ncbi:DUF1345 domain-containing protein [Acidisoma sp. 7E03]